ncbi:hypothetical protein V2H45_22335 [Tumidithrix elongata RA019]|uniref:Uncharacterized protein n=1 Tax=Tumidithrix elongata BACA0141 TaxID=2716417 RepID=A0AAW9Q2Y2_9CYAN|nr:hypothetical protein [Tumidithrix elongata RA019]
MRLVNLAVNVGAIAVCLATTLALQLPQLNQRLVGQTLESDRKAVKQEEARLQLLSRLPPKGLGFNNMIANFAFVSFLQYFGDDEARVDHKTGFGLSPKYFEVIVDRNPRFLNIYIYLSTSVSMFAAAPRKAIALYSKGLESLSPEQEPYAYTVWRRKATDELLFLGDAEAARKSYLKAAEWVERAKFGADAISETKYVAQWSRESAAWLSEKRDLRSAQIAAWKLVLSTAIDKKTLQNIAIEIDKLGMELTVGEDGKIDIVPKKSS